MSDKESSWLPRTLSSVLPLSKQTSSGKDNDKKEWLPSTLVVEKKIIANEENGKSGSGSRGSMLKCLDNRKVVCFIIVYAVIATGLWSLFLGNPFDFGRGKQIEALKEQVKILDHEIEELEEQVDRLGSEVTRLSNETDRLEVINDDLKLTSDDLNKTVTVLIELNDSLNISIVDGLNITDSLDDSITAAQEVNNALVESLTSLGDRIDSITSLNEELKLTQQSLEEEKNMYILITESLESSNVLLSSEISNLGDQLADMKTQNELLSKNNNDLQAILQFLNQAGIDLNTTTNEISEYLADEIEENSNAFLQNLKLYYQKVYKFWYCTSSFDSEFINKPWISNEDAAIGANDYESVLVFVDDNVFQELCASRSDFENFLVSDRIIDYQGTAPPIHISVKTLKAGIERYSTLMMDYYFPLNDDSGLSASDWRDNKYKCQNIPSGERYVWTQV